ncbi:MAG: BamA/TamA family outer membrane protein [Paludibacteraceae bacterium]|nr:BamA/TamA family outer membrane protein [Paludibacteraceae bacterium]
MKKFLYICIFSLLPVLACATVRGVNVRVDDVALSADSVRLGDSLSTSSPKEDEPLISYSMTAKEYTIAGIEVSGAETYDKAVLIGYSKLRVGDKIKVPGEQITKAVKRFWKQGLFSDAKIYAEKISGDKVWLKIELEQRERISEINISGVKEKKKEDILGAIELKKNGIVTPNLISRTKEAIKKHLSGDGYRNAEVDINTRNDQNRKGFVVVNIDIDRRDKVKVHRIYMSGLDQMKESKVKRGMKKTKEKKLVNFFKSKKFIDAEYANDKGLAIEKFNEFGFRDARLLSDSVVEYKENRVDVYMHFEEGRKYYFRNINWVGNTIYSSDVLTAALGIKKGDVYNQKLLNSRLFSDDDAMSNLYLDNGYLFFNVEPVETKVEGDSIDLEMRIYEGQQAVINNVVIKGNNAIYENVIRRELRTKPGELFSKTNLQRSARELAATGHFNPEKMDIRPEPNPENGTVDIVYNLEQKKNDQVELSFGYGPSTGVTGSVGLRFTNFSIKNIFNKSAYRPLPQGDGQNLSLSFSTNGKYYTSASIGFTEPWLGGNRPTSLSTSLYWSRQSGVNSRYYSDNYYNNALYDNTSYSAYSAAVDRNKYIMTMGASVGIGKRLDWPDDYFSLYWELSYRHYTLHDWDMLEMSYGSANNLSISATWSRNSVDNPYYARRGSKLSLMLQLTPPYSLFKDNTRINSLVDRYRAGSPKEEFRGLAEDEYQEMQQDLFRWVEYYKTEFKMQTFTPLSSNQKLVLMTRAEYGFLGYYDSYRRSPFERYYVGGDGMTGSSYTYAQTAIKVRGYGNGDLTPRDAYSSKYAGNIYSRLSLELRYPLMLETATTIYVLGFTDAGNSWRDFSDFNPFDLKRSAGLGVRIFLPMIGLIGVDWGYGFDLSKSMGGGHNFHFVIGQEF